MIDGVLLINKERGIGSSKVVSKVRKLLNTRQVGHCGTLDPLAEGLLILTIGKALKISAYLQADTKEYITTLNLGKTTSSLDLETEFIKEEKINSFTKEDIENAFSKLKGEIEQTPPLYSAISKNGKRLYEYARNNEEVTINSRKIYIYDFKLIDYGKDYITYAIKCSKGTYIRVVNDELAKLLNNIGYTSFIKRTKIGEFSLDKAFTLEDIENNNYKLISIKDSLVNFHKYYLNDFEYPIISHGNIFKKYLEGYQLMLDSKGKEIALYKGDKETKTTKCLRVF